jgi:hypothetical protein
MKRQASMHQASTTSVSQEYNTFKRERQAVKFEIGVFASFAHASQRRQAEKKQAKQNRTDETEGKSFLLALATVLYALSPRPATIL